MKFGQLIERNLKINLCTECSRKTIPWLFSQVYSQTSISIVSSFILLVFILFQVEDYRNILKLSCGPHASNSYKAFLKKTKRGLKLFSLPHFLHDFWKKMLLFVILYYTNKFHGLVAFTSWDIGQHMHCNCFLTRFGPHKF